MCLRTDSFWDNGEFWPHLFTLLTSYLNKGSTLQKKTIEGWETKTNDAQLFDWKITHFVLSVQKNYTIPLLSKTDLLSLSSAKQLQGRGWGELNIDQFS